MGKIPTEHEHGLRPEGRTLFGLVLLLLGRFFRNNEELLKSGIPYNGAFPPIYVLKQNSGDATYQPEA